MAHIKIISIQSCVSYGHVGNSAVCFPLQRLGTEVYPIHTVLFSNHTGYGAWRGQVVEPKLIDDVFLGIKERGVLQDCQGFLTGYMGSKELGNSMINAYHELKKSNPDVLYCCDPVMGDYGRGFFVREGIPEFMKENLISYADIITPNHFELEYLSGQSFQDIPNALIAARKVMELGPKIVVVTSLRIQSSPERLHILAATKNKAFLVSTPHLPILLNGTGDLTSALFAHFFLKTRDLKLTLEECIARVYSVIVKTWESGSKELVLVSAQNQLDFPEHRFKSMDVS